MQDEPSAQEKEKTNALGKKRNWVYEPPESEEAEPQPLTAQEIEDIRQAASEEGFSQGKEEGFAKGYEEGKTKGMKKVNRKVLKRGLNKVYCKVKKKLISKVYIGRI